MISSVNMTACIREYRSSTTEGGVIAGEKQQQMTINFSHFFKILRKFSFFLDFKDF